MLDIIPRRGNKMSGRSAVTAMAVPSPIHQHAIRAETANKRLPERVIPSGNGISKIIEKNINPPINTASFRLKLNCASAKTYSLLRKVFLLPTLKEELFTVYTFKIRCQSRNNRIYIFVPKLKNLYSSYCLRKLKRTTLNPYLQSIRLNLVKLTGISRRVIRREFYPIRW